MATVRVSRALILDAMQSASVRRALRAKADQKARRADQLGSSEGVTIDAKVSEGTRPKGRPYSRVSSENVGQEFGNRYTERRRVLGRVAEGG